MVAWDIENAIYENKSKNVNSQEPDPLGMTLSSDGSKMYLIGTTDKIYQYTMSTLWDISTAVYDNKSKALGSQDSIPVGLYFKPDGTKFFTTGHSNDRVYQYSMSTAFDVSTASYDNKSLATVSQGQNPTALFFKPDGLTLFVLARNPNRVNQYNLSTAWDVSTASYASKTVNIDAQGASPQALIFKEDGTKFFTTEGASDRVYQYGMTTAWDVSTASYDSIFYSVASQSSNPYGMFIRSNGENMYIMGRTTKTVFQYSTGIAETLRKIKLAGVFVDKPILTKVAGSFVDKPIKIKVGGTFQ